MNLTIHPSHLQGRIAIPPSKSHTIRAVFLGLLADGESTLDNPLNSEDTRAALRAARALGAEISCTARHWRIRGAGATPRVAAPDLDLANSGTSMRILLGVASLVQRGELHVTGDAQLRRRPAAPLLHSLRELGADIRSTGGEDCPPFLVRGGLRGGTTKLEAKTSQYVTSLLMACPFAERDSEIRVTHLNEAPYLDITLNWLKAVGVHLEQDGYLHYRIPGGQTAAPFARCIPADFSSATFFLGAGALPNNNIECNGLDPNDPQPDKKVVDYLETMGADIRPTTKGINTRARHLRGCEIDMNETPDALPMMAVLGCFAAGETHLRNVEHARIKETDRIAAMTCELRKMGADIRELQDGMVIRQSALHGANVDGHADHRIVMALAMAAMAAEHGTTTISTAEAMNVTFPDFADLARSLGGTLELSES
ncbi:MAG: 3-phosphoshikimate 1-carboxyvinyltransferase [Verrucomicrobiota bacterium]